MRRILVSSLFICTAFWSCKKDEINNIDLASLRIVNVVAGGEAARVRGYLDPANRVSLNSNSTFSIIAGTPDIYVFPVSDSLHPYYDSNKGIAMGNGEYYTLFLSGVPASPESILLKENFQNYSDSVMAVRFINLSPNSTPVNVTLTTSTTTNEFAGVAYKTITDFKLFPAKLANTTYTFQVRSAANPNTVLSSMAVSLSGTSAIPRFKNITLVFRGNMGGSPAPGITRVNHYP